MKTLRAFRKDCVTEEARYLAGVMTPVVAIDSEMNVIYVNPAGASVLGRSAQGCLGEKCYDLFLTSDCQTPRCACRQAMDANDTPSGRTMAHPGGKSIPIQYVGHPLRDEGGRVTGAVEFVTDLTDIFSVVSQVVGISEGVANASGELSSATKEAGSAPQQVGQAIEQVAKGSASTAQTVGEANRAAWRI